MATKAEFSKTAARILVDIEEQMAERETEALMRWFTRNVTWQYLDPKNVCVEECGGRITRAVIREAPDAQK